VGRFGNPVRSTGPQPAVPPSTGPQPAYQQPAYPQPAYLQSAVNGTQAAGQAGTQAAGQASTQAGTHAMPQAGQAQPRPPARHAQAQAPAQAPARPATGPEAAGSAISARSVFSRAPMTPLTPVVSAPPPAQAYAETDTAGPEPEPACDSGWASWQHSPGSMGSSQPGGG